MAINNDHFHTHDNFKIAGKIIDQVSVLKQRNAELEAKNEKLEAELAALKEERRWRKCSEEMPTAKDANESGKLLGYLGEYKIAHEYHWTDVLDLVYSITHWMPLPNSPEE